MTIKTNPGRWLGTALTIALLAGCNDSPPNNPVAQPALLQEADKQEIAKLAGVWRWRDPTEPRSYYAFSSAGQVTGFRGEEKLKERGQISLDGNVLTIASVGEPVWFKFTVESPDVLVEKSWHNGQEEIATPDGPGWERLPADEIPPHLSMESN